MEGITLDQIISIFGSASLFILASLLVWRRYAKVADDFTEYLKRENEWYRDHFLVGGGSSQSALGGLPVPEFSLPRDGHWSANGTSEPASAAKTHVQRE